MKLIKLLTSVLHLIIRIGLFEERAILLGKLGRHEQALSIYINILKDMPAALEYCNVCYQSDSPSNKEVLHNLSRKVLAGYLISIISVDYRSIFIYSNF